MCRWLDVVLDNHMGQVLLITTRGDTTLLGMAAPAATESVRADSTVLAAWQGTEFIDCRLHAPLWLAVCQTNVLVALQTTRQAANMAKLAMANL